MTRRFTLDRPFLEQFLGVTSLIQQLNRQVRNGREPDEDDTQPLPNLRLHTCRNRRESSCDESKGHKKHDHGGVSRGTGWPCPQGCAWRADGNYH